MTRRRNNDSIPTWMWAVPLGIVAAAIVVGQVRRAIGGAAADAPIYLYWTELMPTAYQDRYPGYVPHLQREDGTEHVTLSGRLTEMLALSDAEAEIVRRGGIPREGKPV